VVRVVGEQVGGMIAGLHRDRGVDLRLGTGVTGTELAADHQMVTLTDGTIVEAGFVLVGVGAQPWTDWIEGSGLELADGVLCDDRGRAVGGDGRIWAVGDVAVWPSARFESTRRIEHWTNATEQAGVLAANLLGLPDAPTHDPVPYVWSDQYEHKVQILGRFDGEDETTLYSGSLEERRFTLLYSRAGVLRGVVAVDSPREVAELRPRIAAADALVA